MTYEMDTVLAENARQVLIHFKVNVRPQEGGFDGMFVSSKNGIIDVRRFSGRFRKRVVHSLARKFKIPVQYFWNPHELMNHEKSKPKE